MIRPLGPPAPREVVRGAFISRTTSTGDAAIPTVEYVDDAIAEVELGQEEMLAELETITGGISDLEDSNVDENRKTLDLLTVLSKQLKIMNFHLSQMTGVQIKEESLE